MVVHDTILDEGELVSIMSSTSLQGLGFPQLVIVTQNFLAFNGGTNQPLGILPKFPITLGGKTVYIDIMIVQCPLDFNILLGCDYVYVMGVLVPSLFRVVCFPHEGRIVTISQLSFQLCGYPFRLRMWWWSTHMVLYIVYWGHSNPICLWYQMTCIRPIAWFFHLVKTSWEPCSLMGHEQMSWG